MTPTKNINLDNSCTEHSTEPGHVVFVIIGQTSWSC